MSRVIPISLAVEDELSEELTLRLLTETQQSFAIRTVYNRGGNSYLRNRIGGFNGAAQGVPFLVVTDLDNATCASDLVRTWLPHGRNPNLLLRVAVREAEAWVLADAAGIADFLGIKQSLVPHDVEALANPKQHLIELARRSRRKTLVKDMCPDPGDTRQIGPNYNLHLANFVRNSWNVQAAARCSNSLARTLNCLREFRPTWAD